MSHLLLITKTTKNDFCFNIVIQEFLNEKIKLDCVIVMCYKLIGVVYKNVLLFKSCCRSHVIQQGICALNRRTFYDNTFLSSTSSDEIKQYMLSRQIDINMHSSAKNDKI